MKFKTLTKSTHSQVIKKVQISYDTLCISTFIKVFIFTLKNNKKKFLKKKTNEKNI